MMHVAEAGEERGRVVLPLCSSSASPVAIEAGKQASYADKMSMNYLIEGVVGDLPKS